MYCYEAELAHKNHRTPRGPGSIQKGACGQVPWVDGGPRASGAPSGYAQMK
jgi:hypothetical protein